MEEPLLKSPSSQVGMEISVNEEHNHESSSSPHRSSTTSEEEEDDEDTKVITPPLIMNGGGGVPSTQTKTATNDDASEWSLEALPANFHQSPEPLAARSSSSSSPHRHPPFKQLTQIEESEEQEPSQHHYAQSPPPRSKQHYQYFTPQFASTKFLVELSAKIFQEESYPVATWLGVWSLGWVTMGVSAITPIRDAVALQIGVEYMPPLTLASSVLAFLSSVPIGWLFEAPDPSRRKLWKKMGLTRGETQGSSLALFYRFFSFCLVLYAVGFVLVEYILPTVAEEEETKPQQDSLWHVVTSNLQFVANISFFLLVHLMKLHSISLVWGVTSEAMEYEDVARKAKSSSSLLDHAPPPRTRLQRLALVGFGGTMGGILGSIMASELVNLIHLPGVLVIAALIMELAAQLSLELGRIMQKHWEEQQIFKSTQDLAGLDSSMQRSTSLGSMKRVASGNSLMRRSTSNQSMSRSAQSLQSLDSQNNLNDSNSSPSGSNNSSNNAAATPITDDNTFTQRLLRGITTILKSRLLMAIFTYNALFASTTVLLSFQRAALVANRNANAEETSIAQDTAFLAKINMSSSIAVFLFQASGIGARIASRLGSQGSLAAMPAIRLAGVLSLAWWHRFSQGRPPNLILFLILDECTRVVNLAVAKPVRESLWRGLSNEARYEAKPIVDTLANRWGAGSASFCVSAVHHVLVWMGRTTASGPSQDEEIMGLPPVIFLCLLVAAWWVMVSLDLGQIRRKIDVELKKRL